MSEYLISGMEEEPEVELNVETALKWYYKKKASLPEQLAKSLKDRFLIDRLMWEDLAAHIANIDGNHPTHDQVKSLIKNQDKAGMLGHDNYEDALQHKEQRRQNTKEWGIPGGGDTFSSMVEKIKTRISGELPRSYVNYINSSAWKKRSILYLNECCLFGNEWICESCGTGHEVRDYDRTIQVHHNRYDILKGEEPNAFLMACCADTCHPTADILRKLKHGKIDASLINDNMRTLFV